MRVTIGIPTLNRYRSLAQTLQSVIFQTYQDFEVIIVDDTEKPSDLRELSEFQNLFRLMTERKIDWKVLYGEKRGQHISHQIIQDQARGMFIWRIDDDEIAEPETLGWLVHHLDNLKAGAVGGLVLTPPPAQRPDNLRKNSIDQPDINIQWFNGNGNIDPVPVDHLHSTFLYRKGIARYELGLSPAAHREETLFTYEIKRAGHPVFVIPQAKTWHLRASYGGIRSHHNPQFWEWDEKLFQTKLAEWGVKGIKTKVVVLDCGFGDHIIFRSILKELKNYERIVVASCYDEVFQGEQVDLISIAEAQNRYGNLDRFNIYRWCLDHNWKGSMQDAFRGLYLT
jgi:glycosyltransferase involved in cell wall biosynthesis